MEEFTVATASDFEDPGHKAFNVAGVEIGVFLQSGTFYAYENVCPHRAGPVCQGRIMPRTLEMLNADRTHNSLQFCKEHSHIVCPWHGLEFDVVTGYHPSSPHIRLRRIDVAVVDGRVVVRLPDGFASQQIDRISLKAAQANKVLSASRPTKDVPDAPKG